MKKLLALMMALIILSCAAYAGIMLPQKFVQKTPYGGKLAMPAAKESVETSFEKEDEKFITENQKIPELSDKAKESIFQKYAGIYQRFRARFPGARIAYGIEIPHDDRANPNFSSVNLAKYQLFQREHPEIFQKMIWASPSSYPNGESIIYSPEKMQQLSHYLVLLEAEKDLPYSTPPEGTEMNMTGAALKVYNENETLRMYLPHVAVSIYSEVNSIVPWSLVSYSDYEAQLLLDARKFITYQPTYSGYMFQENMATGGGLSGITDWNPFISFRFLADNSMIKETQQETIYSLTQWMRENIAHEMRAEQSANRALYGYSGYYPVDKILYPPDGASHWTMGCFGTTSLYAAILRTVNIPISANYSMGMHVAPIFTAANLALVHGDDPYTTYNRRASQEVPIERIFLTKEEFYSLNHAKPVPYNGTIPTDSEMAIWLHLKTIAENAYEFKSYWLLEKRASDMLLNRPYALTLQKSWASDCYMPLFDNDTANSMISALDAEILRIGGGNYSAGTERVRHGLVLAA